MKTSLLTLLQAGALLVCLAGLLFSLSAARRLAGWRTVMERKRQPLAALAALHQEHSRHLAAQDAFEALERHEPVSLSNVAGASLPGTPPACREREAVPLAGGWTLRRVEVLFEDIDLVRLPDFLHAAETQRPPWRLAECALSALPQSEGRGRATLVLEAIGKGAAAAKPAFRSE